MRVLMFGWEFPPHMSGGLGTACLGLTRAMSDLGQEITFVMPRARTGDEPDHVRLFSTADVPMDPLDEPHDAEGALAMETAAESLGILLKVIDSPLSPYLRQDQYPSSGAGTGGILASPGDYGPDMMAEVLRYGRVAGVIAGEGAYDVIHGHDWMAVPAALEARRICGRPFVYHVHALEIDRSGENVNPAIFTIEQIGMAAADEVIAVSHYTKSLITDRYGIPGEKVTVVHNAVTRQEAEPIYHVHKRPEKQMVLFMGRLTFQKGPDYFVEAAAQVLAILPEVTFIMAGAGDLLPQMIERVAELGIGRQVHFTGFLTGADIERIFTLSDLYIMPSVSEPFGITPLEAMLHDVPVIISKQSGVGEVLHHVPKVDFWDVNTLAMTIIAVLTQPKLAAKIVSRSRREVEALRWENAAQKVLEVYRRAIDR